MVTGVMALLKSLAMPVTVIAIMVVGFLMLFADRKHPALFRVAVAAFVIGGASQIAIWLLGGAGSF
jgi:predicted membrane metal-binding protein